MASEIKLVHRNAIATVVSHITKGDVYRKKHSAALILIDIEKAFEMISPTVILHTLVNIGIGGKMLSWIHDFLNGRTGTVQIQNGYSSSMTFKNERHKEVASVQHCLVM